MLTGTKTADRSYSSQVAGLPALDHLNVTGPEDAYRAIAETGVLDLSVWLDMYHPEIVF